MNVFDKAFSDQPVKAPVATDDKPEVDEPVLDETEATTEEPAESSSAQEPKPGETPKAEGQTQEKVATVPHAALHAEKERRRQAEAELAALKSAQPAKPATSVLEDEDKAFQERLSAHTRPLVQRFLNMSIAAAKRAPGREDYQEIYDFMNEEVREHPELMQVIDQADDPGEFIYQLGKTRKELAAVGGDITKLREQATAEMREQLTAKDERIKALEAELARAKASEEKRSKIPSSLNTEQSGSPKDDTWSGPRPLKAVFNN
jgi:hypothetical protein